MLRESHLKKNSANKSKAKLQKNYTRFQLPPLNPWSESAADIKLYLSTNQLKDVWQFNELKWAHAGIFNIDIKILTLSKTNNFRLYVVYCRGYLFSSLINHSDFSHMINSQYSQTSQLLCTRLKQEKNFNIDAHKNLEQFWNNFYFWKCLPNCNCNL